MRNKAWGAMRKLFPLEFVAHAAKKAKPSKWSVSKFGKIVEGAGLVLGGGDQQNMLSKQFISGHAGSIISSVCVH